MKGMQRFISVWLAVCLLVSMLPMQVFAVEDNSNQANTVDIESINEKLEGSKVLAIEGNAMMLEEVISEEPMQAVSMGAPAVKWIDRIANLPSYGRNLYNWLVENSDNDGIYDAMIDPTTGHVVEGFEGNYYAEVTSRPNNSTIFRCSDYATIEEFFEARDLALDSALEKDHAAWYKEIYAYIPAVYSAFWEDHPEVFWLSGECWYTLFFENIDISWISTDTYKITFDLKIYFTLMTPEYDLRNEENRWAEDIRSKIAERDRCVEKIVSGATGNRYEQVRYLNNWLTTNNGYCTADPEYRPLDSMSCLNALRGTNDYLGPVSSGYADAFKVLCDKLGIPCVLVDGQSGDGRCKWNYVQMEDGKWYAVDVTRNDPIVEGSTAKKTGYETEEYLLVGSNTVVDGSAFSKSHIVENEPCDDGSAFTNGPTLADEKYIPADHTHSYTEKVTAPTCTERGYTTYTCECGDSYVDNYVVAKGHTEVTVYGTPATCIKDGLTDGEKCSVCGEILVAQKVLPAKGHDYQNGYCRVCGSEEININVKRVAGGSRYSTCIAVADELKATLGGGYFSSVVVASGADFPDALAGTYLAAVKNAPILLIADTHIAMMVEYIGQNLAANGIIYILGSENSVSAKAAEALSEVGRVKRLGGKSRFITNLKILEETKTTTGELLVVYSVAPWDALSVSSSGCPILLVNSKLRDDQKQYLATTNFSKITIIGSTAGVPEIMEAELSAYCPNIHRVYGRNRYLTSIEVAKYFYGTEKDRILVACGTNFPDGLCSGALAYAKNAPVILTDAGREPLAADYVLHYSIQSGYVVGSKNVVSDETVQLIFGKNPVIPPTDSSDVYTVSFDTNGGSEAGFESQSVKHGSTASFPGIPTKTGYSFAGWYLDKNEPDLMNQYNFSTPVTSNLVLHAQWINMEKDTDGDGIADELEAIYGSDPNNADTDNDGLTDYQECIDLGTNPTLVDTDKDGVSDFDEDADNDGLSNGREYELGTSPYIPDTDYDDLSDGEEISVHKTNPDSSDTDGDGADDSWEIENGFNPTVYNSSFDATAQADAVNVSASVTASIGGGKVSSLKVTPVVDHPILNSKMPGYIDVPFEFTVEDNLQGASATIQFSIKSGVQRNADFNPTIYFYNESTQELEELDTTVNGDVVSAVVTHFSTYILLNKTAFDKVWETEIKAPIDSEDGSPVSIDVVFVIDSSGSMSSYKRLTTAKAALHTFISALSEKDRAALVKFNTSATVLSNLTIDKAYVDSKVDSVKASGNTSMYTGFNAALSMLCNVDETYGYKMIIILSDGSDVPSTSYDSKYAPLVQQAVDNNIVVYTIGAGTSVDTSILTQIATNTGGSYYTATVTSGILDAFDQIQGETVDLVTDTDEDGLPDYYEQNLTNSAGVPLNLDIKNPDCDGDGLLDGEEVEIVVADDGKVYSLMKTDPWSSNTDGDGYSDYEEVEVFYSDPLDKNIVFMNSDTDFIIEDENFVSDKYLDCYENELIGWIERGGVWIGNRVFAANYDDVYLYKAILMQYLEDMTNDTAIANENSEWLKTGYNIAKGIKGNIDNAIEILDIKAKPEEVKLLAELKQQVIDYQKKLDDFSPADLNKAGYTSEQITQMSNDLFNKYIETSKQIPELDSKVEFNTQVSKFSKHSKAIGVVFDLLDYGMEIYDVHDKYNKFAAKINEMENCLDSLALIMNSKDANKNLRAAAQELYNAIDAERVGKLDELFDVLKQTGGKLTNQLAWAGLVTIPVVGKYLVIVKAALDLVDFMFNMGDVSEQCACLYAISKSSSILAKDFRSTISYGHKVGSWTIIYGDYATAEDCYFSLAVMRGTSENQMKKADKANSFLIEWLFTKIMYKIEEIDANLDKLNELKFKYVVPGGC